MIGKETTIGLDSYDERRFLSWLSRLMKPDHFDVVVTVERKATAVVRTLMDMPIGVPCEWDWSRVLSSDAIPYLPAGWLKGKRILVFNEMIHHGRSTKQAIQVIGENSPDALRQVYTAAFIVHEEFDKLGSWRTTDFRGHSAALSPDHALQRGVSDRLYRIVQQSLVESLRDRGALLLDTEHLETTFSHTMPNRKFLDALCTFGEPIEYAQDDEGVFPGVTIRSPVVADIERVRAASRKQRVCIYPNLVSTGPSCIRKRHRQLECALVPQALARELPHDTNGGARFPFIQPSRRGRTDKVPMGRPRSICGKRNRTDFPRGLGGALFAPRAFALSLPPS